MDLSLWHHNNRILEYYRFYYITINNKLSIDLNSLNSDVDLIIVNPLVTNSIENGGNTTISLLLEQKGRVTTKYR